jgi:hypothetical protein
MCPPCVGETSMSAGVRVSGRRPPARCAPARRVSGAAIGRSAPRPRLVIPESCRDRARTASAQARRESRLPSSRVLVGCPLAATEAPRQGWHGFGHPKDTRVKRGPRNFRNGRGSKPRLQFGHAGHLLRRGVSGHQQAYQNDLPHPRSHTKLKTPPESERTDCVRPPRSHGFDSRTGFEPVFWP